MKFEKALGLAAVAAFIVVALAIAGTAAATQICRPVESGGDGKCPDGSLEKELAKGESFTATSTDLVLTGQTSSVSCSSSTARLRMISENSISLVEGLITALSYTDCKTSGGTACTTTVTGLPYEAVVHPPDVIVSDPQGIVVGFKCGFLVRCELKTREQLLEVEGNQLVASSERPSSKKGFCPLVPRLDATYTTRPELTFSGGS